MGNTPSSEDDSKPQQRQTTSTQNNSASGGSNISNNAAPAPVGWVLPPQQAEGINHPTTTTPNKTNLYPKPPPYSEVFQTKQPVIPQNPTAPKQHFPPPQHNAQSQHQPSPQFHAQPHTSGSQQYYAQPTQQFYSQPAVSSQNVVHPVQPSMPKRFPSQPVHSTSKNSNTNNWVQASHGVIPPNAFQAGHDTDGSQIFICRAAHAHDLVPGKMVRTHKCAYIAYGGEEHAKRIFEILVGDRYRWVPCRADHIPTNAVEGGHCGNGEKLYIGRARFKNSLTPGKIHPSHKSLYVPYGGQERHFSEFEILIYD